MRLPIAAILLLLVAARLPAQDREPVVINKIMVGFPTANQLKTSAGVTESLYKEGYWTPVFVNLTAKSAAGRPLTLLITSPDCDEVPSRYRVTVPPLAANQTETLTAYTRVGGRRAGVRVAIVDASSERELMLPVEVHIPNLDRNQFLIHSIGSQLNRAKFPGLSQDAVAAQTDERTMYSAVTRLDEMPTQWFGYGSCDLVILNTTDRDFTTALVSERDGRKAALADWVRRGGNLVVSVGRNQDLMNGAGELAEALPVRMAGTADVEVPRIAWTDGIASETPLGKTTCATLEPRPERNPHPLLSMKERALVVRGAYGFGRVTVVGFDIDGKPLDEWRSRESFWRELVQRAGPNVPITAEPRQGGMRYGGPSVEDSEFEGVVRGMETFPGVPVISFGWVALFILGYILLVGPIDYLFLKKVVKRMEYTWITFPIIVFTVSAVAYYAAYAMKGGDLRINKFDLVDIDVRSRLVQGRSWFTLFSPRIQNYRIGVEPSLGSSIDGLNTHVTWSGLSRNARQSLFPRSYDYAPKAAGIENVPIQVWSTKGFQSEWLTAMDGTIPIASSTLQETPDRRGLSGQIRLNLPVKVENAFLLYSGGQRDPTVRRLGTILPGEPKSLSGSDAKPARTWATSPFARDRESELEQGVVEERVTPRWFPLRAFFHDFMQNSNDRLSNASLRSLDQSWRISVDNPGEAILIGTLPSQDGPAEQVNAEAGSSTRLWLGAFPGGSTERPKLLGTLRQDTCIRVFFPVKTAPESPRN